MARTTAAVRRAKEEYAFWSVLSLRLFEARGALLRAARHCENDERGLGLGSSGKLEGLIRTVDAERAEAVAARERLAPLCGYREKS